MYTFLYSHTHRHRLIDRHSNRHSIQTQHTDTSYRHSAREKGETYLVLYMAVVFIFSLLLLFLRSIEGDRAVEEGSVQHVTMSDENMWRISTYIYPFISLDISFGLFRYMCCCYDDDVFYLFLQKQNLGAKLHIYL